MESLNELGPEDLLALANMITLILYRSTPAQDLSTLALLVTAVGDMLALLIPDADQP